MTPKDIAERITAGLNTAESRPQTAWEWSAAPGPAEVELVFRSDNPHVLDFLALFRTFDSVYCFHWMAEPSQRDVRIKGKIDGQVVSATFLLDS